MSILHENAVNLYITLELHSCSKDLNTDFALCNCLFGPANLNADLDKYKYSRYSRGFDSRSEFLWIDGRVGKNTIILGADNSPSGILMVEKNILVFVERPI